MNGMNPEQSVSREAVPRLLSRVSSGDAAAVNDLLPLVYGELRARAGSYFRSQPANHTLQPTALVHEAFLKLVNAPDGRWNDRAHFCAVAATAMRQILTDHARRRAVKERVQDERANATQVLTPSSNSALDVLDLDNALIKLAKRNAEQARLVELRFFGGMAIEEIAEVLSLSVSTVQREWRKVRAWLLLELKGADAP